MFRLRNLTRKPNPKPEMPAPKTICDCGRLIEPGTGYPRSEAPQCCHDCGEVALRREYRLGVGAGEQGRFEE